MSRSFRNRALRATAAFVGGSLAFIGVAASSAGASVSPKATPHAVLNVTVGASTSSILNLPIWVAQDNGYFTQHNLNVKLVILSASTVNAALTSGSVQFLNDSPTAFLQARAQGIAQTAIAADAIGVPLGFVISTKFAQAHGITAKTPTATVAKDLIGSTGGSSAAATTGEAAIFLNSFGVATSQYTVATFSNPAADEAALQSNQIEWFCTSEPIPLEVQAAGYGLVVATPKNVAAWSPRRTGVGEVLAANTSYATQNPGAVKEFALSVQQATAEIGKHEQQVLNVAQENVPGVARPLLLKAYALLDWPQSDKMNVNQWRTTVAFIVKEGAIPHGSKVTEGVDWSNQYL